MKISEWGEFGLIRKIRDDLKNFQERAIIGIGDDAAAVEISPQRLALFTSDSLVENVHFEWEYASPGQIGWKALAVNISDIAAMGGAPGYALVSLALPQDTEISVVEGIYEGLKKAAASFKINIIGGDIVHSPIFIITVSLWGEVKKEEIISRCRAKEGDLIYVTGELGTSGAGLTCLKRDDLPLDKKTRQFLMRRHLMPFPRLREGQQIAQKKIATAMIDLSDGLASDLSRLSEESKVGAVIWEERLPMAIPTRELARKLGRSPLEWALYGGEDYELLFTASRHKGKMMEKALNFSFTLIGKVVSKEEGISLIDSLGNLKKMEDRGYDHLRRS